jgi:hypothetical protein
MKILCYKYSQDPIFEALLSVLSESKYECAFASGELKQEHIATFSPDIIMHNIPHAKEFPIKNNAISININETETSNSFSLNEGSKNYIGKFIQPRSTVVHERDIPKFTSDVVYIGSPAVFGDVLEFILNNDIQFKFFTHQPHNIAGYCGMCSTADYGKYYRYAKASICLNSDTTRLMDIVASDGNPILYDPLNPQRCKDQIFDAIENGTRYDIEGYSKSDILKKYTSYDAVSKIFKTIGLTKIADEILKIKKQRLLSQ